LTLIHTNGGSTDILGTGSKVVAGGEAREAMKDDAAGPSPRHDDVSPPGTGDDRLVGTATVRKETGWYPAGTNPNEQAYWDGHNWTRRRRWNAGTGWSEASADPMPAMGPSGVVAPGPRYSANPYAARPASTPPSLRPVPGVTVGLFLLVLSTVAMMAGSATTWVSTSSSLGSAAPGRILGISTSISTATSGVDEGVSELIGINGYITLIAAVVVLVFAGLMMISYDRSVRVIGFGFTLVSLGLSIFALVRLAQKINQAHLPHGISVNVGWGMFLLLGAAVLATLIGLFEVFQRR
jgi:hypothetical protein